MDERERPQLDETPRPVAAGADPRRLYAVIGLLLVIIVLLVIRPWGDDGSGSSPPAADRAATIGPATPPATGIAAGDGTAPGAEATPGPAATDAYADLRETCASPSGWRAATLQEWAGRTTPIRSWIAIDPVEADGPLDPRIPFAPVATGVVTAIGFCAPLDDASRPPVSAVASLWSIGQPSAGATPLALQPLEPSSPDALGGLWLPPPGLQAAGGGSAAREVAAGRWPPGRYAIELRAPDGGYRRWLGIEIADLSLRRAIPAPSPSAGAAAGGEPSGEASGSPTTSAAPVAIGSAAP